MWYGLCLPNGGQVGDPRVIGELAELAEASGWDGIFLEDYVVWQGHQQVPTHNPWVLLAIVAMHTKRVRLGLTVTPLPSRRSWNVVREAITLDHLSNGRMTLGFGLGDASGDVSISHFGSSTDNKTRAKMLDEALDIVAGLMTGEPFHYDGEHYHIKEITILPRPVQHPRIPIWIGGGYPLKGPTERAARWDGSVMYKQPTNGQSEDWAAEDIRAFRQLIARRRGTTEGYDIAVGGRARDEDWDKDRALIKSLADAGVTWWMEYMPPELGGLDIIRSAIERGPLRT